MSPSPTFRDGRRAMKTQSLPLGSTVAQLFNNQNPAQSQAQNQASQPSPTSLTTRRSPPPPTQQAPPPPNLPSPTNHTTTSPQVTPPPHKQHSPPIHNPQVGYPRPIPRIPPPPFLKQFHGSDEKWPTPEFLADIQRDIERSDLVQPQHSGPPGSCGVAYAGGAGGYTAHVEPESPPKDPMVDRVRSNDRSSPKEPEHRRQQPSGNRKPNSPHTPERHNSPAYHSSLASTGDHSTSAYPPYKRDSYSSHQRSPTPPTARRTSNTSEPLPLTSPPATSKQTPPQANRPTPDRSLPVQEEPEEDHVVSNTRGSPTPSSDTLPESRPQHHDTNRATKDSRDGFRNEDSETLIEHDSDDANHGQSQEDDSSGYTPRSPHAELHEHPRDSFPPPQNGAAKQNPFRAKTRAAAVDQLGMRSIDPAIFEPSSRPSTFMHAPRYLPHPHQPYQPSNYHDGYLSDQNTTYGHYADDIEGLLNEPALAYIQSYLRSPRPNAPIPPTPHSQTAAPSPSPQISNSDSGSGFKDPPLPVGSPYPYPYSHVRRPLSFSSTPNQSQPPSTYDPNHPSAIQEQLELQWQMYARNNNGHISDSTLSPSASPFQGPGYNPWAFLHTARALGGRRMEHSMSLRSSPSHEPISLPPPPPMRGKGSLKRRERSGNLRTHVVRGKVQPPPRVESTQPRETSPEPSSSGEETAGEDRYQITEEGNWVNGAGVDDTADWIDEDAEADEDDLLELEYHPTFVNNVEKRRRRWETRWEALVQAVSYLTRLFAEQY
jgi:hypothetical protein